MALRAVEGPWALALGYALRPRPNLGPWPVTRAQGPLGKGPVGPLGLYLRKQARQAGLLARIRLTGPLPAKLGPQGPIGR